MQEELISSGGRKRRTRGRFNHEKLSKRWGMPRHGSNPKKRKNKK